MKFWGTSFKFWLRPWEEYRFLAWLDPFTRLPQTNSNLLPSEDNAGAEILDEFFISSASDSKASESDCESLANDLSAVTQKRVGTSTKLLGTSYKLVKKPIQNELAASQLKMMRGMAQVMRQRLGKKTVSPAQESAEDVSGKMVAFELKKIS